MVRDLEGAKARLEEELLGTAQARARPLSLAWLGVRV
jgi:hypothetical protein